MAPNVNSVLTFSRLDEINSNALKKEFSQAEPKFFIKKITATKHRVITFAPPCILINFEPAVVIKQENGTTFSFIIVNLVSFK